MKTSDFKYFDFPFIEFNKAQNKVMPLIDKGSDLVVSFPPGAGKTVIAEACFGYHLKTSDKKVAYVCPLRSLANQKVQDWSLSFKEYDPFLISGDSHESLDDTDSKRLGVFTAESFDSALREKHLFFNSLSCVCFDEVHLLGDPERGGAYESAIMTLTRDYPHIRLVLLSGTLTNARDIAKWIKSLTNKETALAVSDWRPIQFTMNFHYVEKWTEINKVVELLKNYKDTKTIVFVHSKLTGKAICDKLKEKKIRHVFHNANLPENKRKHIENLFSDKYSGVDVIVATSTLAAGVNLA